MKAGVWFDEEAKTRLIEAMDDSVKQQLQAGIWIDEASTATHDWFDEEAKGDSVSQAMQNCLQSQAPKTKIGPVILTETPRDLEGLCGQLRRWLHRALQRIPQSEHAEILEIQFEGTDKPSPRHEEN